MPVGLDYCRDMRPGEGDEVDALLRAAFPGPEEARLVRDLRASGEMVWEVVAPWRDQIAAYAGISRMAFPANWFCLAPVAVWPEWQNGALGRDEMARNSFRFGSRLVGMMVAAFGMEVGRQALAKSGGAASDEPVTLVVLGKPSFYARAGFSRERAARLTSPYPIANTLIARAGDDVPEETLVYPPAFAGV